jgi:hypothetical protein
MKPVSVEMTTVAAAKVDHLELNRDMTSSGVFLRHKNGDCCIVTTEGRVEWFRQNTLGGIETEVPKRGVDTFGFSIVDRRHR